MNMNHTRYAHVHAYVSGRVQGVGFRFYTIACARRFGITGWVKNLFDGRVEIEAEGELPNLRLFIDEIRVGPAHAHVSHLADQWNDIVSPKHKDFSLLY
jgi:acylphosphatase